MLQTKDCFLCAKMACGFNLIGADEEETGKRGEQRIKFEIRRVHAYLELGDIEGSYVLPYY